MTPERPAYPLDIFIQMLGALQHILEVARRTSTAAEGRALAHARLAPNMFDLSQHVDLTCRHALEAATRLSGEPETDFGSDGSGLEGLEATVGRARQLLERNAAHLCDPPFGSAMVVQTTTGQKFQMSGREMVEDWAMPQFYFHLVTVYAILRGRGIDLGIRDYLGHMGRYLAPGGGI